MRFDSVPNNAIALIKAAMCAPEWTTIRVSTTFHKPFQTNRQNIVIDIASFYVLMFIIFSQTFRWSDEGAVSIQSTLRHTRFDNKFWIPMDSSYLLSKYCTVTEKMPCGLFSVLLKSNVANILLFNFCEQKFV